MTELNDHIKLLYARAANLFDRDTADSGAARFCPDHLMPSCCAGRAMNNDPRLGVDLSGRVARRHYGRGSAAVAAGQRLHPCAGRAGSHPHPHHARERQDQSQGRNRGRQDPRCGGRPLPHWQRGAGARAGSHRGSVEAWHWPPQRLCAKRGSSPRGYCASSYRKRSKCRAAYLALLYRLALPAQRLALRRPGPQHVQLQLGRGRVRGLPRFRACGGGGLWAGHSQRQAHPARRGHQAHADSGLGRSARTT